MSVLSVSSTVTEVPGVNNAVEHLQELGEACVTFTTVKSKCECKVCHAEKLVERILCLPLVFFSHKMLNSLFATHS